MLRSCARSSRAIGILSSGTSSPMMSSGARSSRALGVLTSFSSRSMHLTSVAGRTWRVYLSGEIHSDWRERIAEGVKNAGLPVVLTSPNISHEDSDDCGAIILGTIACVFFSAHLAILTVPTPRPHCQWT